MSERNVELVRSWFDGLARGDPSPEMCDPEVRAVVRRVQTFRSRDEALDAAGT
jgi:hypothetical protein